jgi:thioredoxin 1
MSTQVTDSLPLISKYFLEGQTDVVVVDFWAEWCPPCKAMSPILDQIAEEMPNVKVIKISVDEEPHNAQKFEVRSIPTFLIFNKKEYLTVTDSPSKRLVGAMSKNEFEDLIKSVL